jgi:hypothetical protein
MNKTLLTASILALVAISLFSGCVERTTYVARPGEVIVHEAPPPPQYEVIVAAPGPEFIWVPGFWAWRDRWVWVPGHHVIRPHARAVWVPDRWVRRGHGYVHVTGHWRR